jgi:hypothetical protein
VQQLELAFDYVLHRSSAFARAVAAPLALSREPQYTFAGVHRLPQQGGSAEFAIKLTAASAATALATSELPN